MTTRYALYFVPGDDSELAQYGFSMIGRDGLNQPRVQPEPEYPNHQALVQNACVYGFHATLKAPFRLKGAMQIEDVMAACTAVAQRHQPISLARLTVLSYRGFCALALPDDESRSDVSGGPLSMGALAVNELAADCVKSLEPFRAPLTEAETARRQPDKLTQVQRELLEEYGYPYVCDEFSFHMTLSNRLAPEACGFVNWAGEIYRRKVTEIPFLDRLALCKQAGQGAAFVRMAEFPLTVSRRGG